MVTPPIPEELWKQIPPAAQAALVASIATLQAQIGKLEARVAELEARLHQNSSNSSKPPSSDPPYAKPAPTPKPTGKRQGGQPGHPKHTPPLLPPTDAVELRVTTCNHCHQPLTGDDPQPLVHQVIEIPPVQPLVTHYRRHRLLCPHCQHQTGAPLPAGVRGGYGERVQAVCALLSSVYRIGKRGVARLCKELFHVPISAACVCKLQHSTSVALQPITQEIQTHLVSQPANVDETGWRENGERRHLWVAVGRWFSVFLIRPSRQRVNLSVLIPGELGVLTTDRFCAYDHLKGAARQVCWAHLRRDFQAMIDRQDAGSVVGKKLLACSTRVLKHWRCVRAGALSRADFTRRYRGRLQREVKALLGQGCRCPDAATTRRACAEIQRSEDSLWTFASVEGVEPTNNAAERALRAGVCWRKMSYGTDSEGGSRFVERILSVIESCRQQGRDLLGFLTQAIHSARMALQPPSLIPLQA